MSKIYDQHNNEASKEWFSGCCGARYMKAAKPRPNAYRYRGISVIVGEHGTKESGEKMDVDHIITKNGTITAAVRHVW